MGAAHRGLRAGAAPARAQVRQPPPLAGYLYGRTGGCIVSLSHLIRDAVIMAILSGTACIGEALLDAVELDRAAADETAAQRLTARKTRERAKR